MEQYHIDTEAKRDNAIEAVRNKAIGEYGFVLKFITGRRTTKQNSAMHMYFGLLANELNQAGLEIHMEYLGKSIDVPWNTDSVKERIWKPVMEAITGKTSTTKLDRKEVSEVYEVIHRHMAAGHGIMCPFPQSRYEP